MEEVNSSSGDEEPEQEQEQEKEHDPENRESKDDDSSQEPPGKGDEGINCSAGWTAALNQSFSTFFRPRDTRAPWLRGTASN